MSRNSCTAVLATILIIVASAGYAAQTESPDGRFGTRCRPRQAGDVCEVSFFRLLAVPERYDGKVVAVTGFLINVFSQPTLFPSRESYNSNVPVEGIFVDGPIPTDIREHLQNGIAPVFIVATFDAKFQGNDFPRLGALRKVFKITMALDPPTGIPAGP
jgi:hypothetical protein